MRVNVAGIVIGSLVLVPALVGCGKSTHSNAPSPHVGSTRDVAAMVDSAFVHGSLPPPNADPAASLMGTLEVGGLRGAGAVFVTSSGFPSAGTVTVRTTPAVGGPQEVALDVLTTDYLGSPAYAYTSLGSHPLGLSLAFDGAAYHRFTVSGRNPVPAFVDSVKSVGAPELSAPGDGATVSRTQDLTLTWTDPGTDSTVYVFALVGSLVDSTKYAPATLGLDQSGTATVGTTSLSALPAGAARLIVARYRLAYHTVGSLKVGFLCESAVRRDLTLN